ncbi:hypothetical protein KR222_007259, partial [Zaprionus bogoriensis]
VAKGSMSSMGRLQRRRVARLSSRLRQISKLDVPPTSVPADGNKNQTEQSESMELDDSFTDTSLQILRAHSSGSGNSNSNINNIHNKNSNNIKTVLQPTMLNSNSNNNYCNGNHNGNNKPNAAKLRDEDDQKQVQVQEQDDDNEFDDEDEQGDSDSGYEFALEPSKHSAHINSQHHQCQTTHNEGLLSIALKTIKLVQRNKLLQKRLAQLQLETSEFIASVLANPENRHFREITAKTEPLPIKVSNVLLRN